MRYINHPIVPGFFLPVSSETIAGSGLYPYYRAPNMGNITSEFVTKNKLKGVIVVDNGNNILVRAISSEEHSSTGSKWIFNAKQANSFISLLQTNPQSITPNVVNLDGGDAWNVEPALQQGQVTTSLLWVTEFNVPSTDMGNSANPWIRRYFRRSDEHLFDIDAQYHRIQNPGWNQAELDELLFGIAPKYQAFVSMDSKWLYVKAIGDYRVTSTGIKRTFDAGLTRAFSNVLTRPNDFRALIVSSSAGTFEDSVLMWVSTEQSIIPLPINGEWIIVFDLTSYEVPDTCQSVDDCVQSNIMQPPPQIHVHNVVYVPTQPPNNIKVDAKKDNIIMYPVKQPETMTNTNTNINTNTTPTTTNVASEETSSGNWWLWLLSALLTLGIGYGLYWMATNSETETNTESVIEDPLNLAESLADNPLMENDLPDTPFDKGDFMNEPPRLFNTDYLPAENDLFIDTPTDVSPN
jgi:hypothetical protein